MKNISVFSASYQTCWQLWIALIIFTICLVSADIAIAQKPINSDKHIMRVNGQVIKHIARTTEKSVLNCERLSNRTFDGTCNNIFNTERNVWGATDIPLFREMDASYGAPDFYNEMSGNCRLSARAVSNLICTQTEDILSPRNLSSLVFTWGQFLDHDIDLTPEGHTEYTPVLLPSNEPLFSSPIPFFRSLPYGTTGTNIDRQQQNIITSWIDASQVYGSDETRANWLRTFTDGKLKTSEGNLLPYNTLDGNIGSAIDANAPSMAGDGSGTNKVFVAGDVRANEQPGLTTLHTLFVREHNRTCDALRAQGMTGDETIYQRARKIIGGYMQAISYGGFLPALGIDIAPYLGYNASIRPDISNMFATAAYRLGHTMVTNDIPIIDANCNAVDDGSIALLEGFFNPSVVSEYGVAVILQGLAAQTQQKVDAQIVDNLRNFLFPSTDGGPAFGLDLASLNIQRGRDHALPDYNSVRAHYTGLAAEDFNDITSDIALQNALETAYGSVYNIDLWVGLLSEDPENDSSIGMTLNVILSKQFEQLRNGDFYYYQNDPAFTPQQRTQISNTTLQDIIIRNTAVENLQENVFFANDCTVNNDGGNGDGGNPDGGGNGGGGNPGGGGNGPGGGNGGGGNPGGGGNGSGGGNGGGGNPGGGGNGPGGGNPGGGGNGGGPITGNLANNNFNIYPNPSNGKIQIEVQLPSANEEVFIQVQKLDGSVMYGEQVTTLSEALFHELDLSALSVGMYFVTVQSGEEILIKRVVVQ